MIRPRSLRMRRGTRSYTVTTGSRTYASSIDAGIANLVSRYSYDPGYTVGLPILVLMHGYGETTTALRQGTRERFAGRGFFVVVPGMRGRDGASGSRDASGREIQDIIDAVEDIRTGFSSIVDPDRVVIAGYSGGGGNTIGAVAKAPDYWTAAVTHFGPSDYGWRTTTGWYYTDTSFQASLTTDVGAAPTAQPGWWRSRNHADALAYQYKLAPKGASRLWLYHDESDGSVDVAQSDRVTEALDDAGLTEIYEYHRSDSGDPTNSRYLHGYPEDSFGVQSAEEDWWEVALNADPWRVPYAGEALVAGFLRTKLFRIWLGLTSGGANPKTDASGGKSHVARVQWELDKNLDEAMNVFRILPLTGSVRYRIEIGALTLTGDTSDPVEVTL